MITEQERIIRRSQGYDIDFEYNDKKYWINSYVWNEDKEKRLFLETGLRSFREETGDKNLVFYNPDFFDIVGNHLHYKNTAERDIPQPINMSSAYKMFQGIKIASIDLSNWVMHAVNNLEGMFDGCTELLSLNTANWDLKNVINTQLTFCLCNSLTSLDLSHWDLENVHNVSKMFYYCSRLNNLKMPQLPDTVSGEEFMFTSCYALEKKYNTTNSIDILRKLRTTNDSENKMSNLNVFC